jgi:hypothetical protein
MENETNHIVSPADMLTINFNANQLASLKVFLERSEVKGYEVGRFIELARLIGEAEQNAASSQPVAAPAA